MDFRSANGARDLSHRSETLKLKDGRALGYTDPGPAAGVPVFYFHGFPGSRLEAGLLPTPGLRLIGVDRPGYGLSSAKRGRRLGDWPADILALADHLGFAKFAVLAVSGGAPYAAACAHALPERLTAAVLMCGVGPPEAPGMGWGRLGTLLKVGRNTVARALIPAAARQFIISPRTEKRMIAMRRRLYANRAGGVAREMEAMTEDFSAFMLRSWREGLSRTSSGIASDARIYGEPWPFPLSEIRVPVHLWHGVHDRVVPVDVGRYYAENIPGIRAEFREGEGHYSVIKNSVGAVIRTIVAHATP